MIRQTFSSGVPVTISFASSSPSVPGIRASSSARATVLRRDSCARGRSSPRVRRPSRSESPDMSGLEVYQRIRQIDARIPVIFVTQTTSTDTAIEAMRPEPSITSSNLSISTALEEVLRKRWKSSA